jgi:hypothetical protein
MTYEDAGTRTLGDRSTMVPPPAPVVWFRIVRSGSQLSADYSLTDPEQGGIWTPLTFGGGSVSAVDLSTVFAPADGPVYIGLYGGNGSVTAGFDYVRFEPDEPGDCDPPTTTVQLNGADPVASYDGPVEVTLEATDGAGGSGVASTEYALDGGSLQEYTGPFTVAEPGSHEIEFFSSDNAGNVEETQSVSFEIEEGGAPDLRLAVRPKRESAKVGKVARFTATARNLGDTAAGAVRLCAKGPRSKVKVKVKACTTRASLAPGAAFAPTFKLAPKRAARGQQVRITFTASSPGAGTERATATLAVRRR